MTLAYILIEVTPGSEEEVAEKLVKYKNVEDVHLLFGEFDIIAELEEDSITKLQSFVVHKIRKIPGVIGTRTLMVADEE